MNTVTIVLLVILAILIIAVVALYFLGKKAQKRQAEQQQQIDAMKQTVSMLIIDKKRMKLKDSGLPQAVIEQAPKLMRHHAETAQQPHGAAGKALRRRNGPRQRQLKD